MSVIFIFSHDQLPALMPEERTVDMSLEKPYINDGIDWSLPSYAKISDNSGLINENEDNPDVAYSQHYLYLLLWDKANPKKGKYDFSGLERFLKDYPKKKLLIRLEVHSACETPAWALKTLQVTKHKSLVFWDGQYRKTLKPFLDEFAKRYANHPQIAGVQLGIGDGEYKNSCNTFENKDGWGEFWMTEQELIEAEDDFALTPEKFQTETFGLIDTYAEVFGENKKKLAFTNSEPFYSSGSRAIPYNARMTNIARYAFEHGIGNRDGAIEEWMRYTQKSFGMEFSPNKNNTCQLDMNEAFADSLKDRYWGTENEFYGKEDYILAANGPYRNQPYRFFVSSLRALQMRRNHFTIFGESMAHLDTGSKPSPYNTQAFLHYLSKTLGKQRYNTPDAFILLGERYINTKRTTEYDLSDCTKNNTAAIRSFGRWLNESSDSEPSMRVNMYKEENRWGQDFYLPDGINHEFAARKGSKFNFQLNQQLKDQRCPISCDIEVKISFKDDVETKLRIDFGNNKTQWLDTNGDGKIKTASFPLYLSQDVQRTDFSLKAEDDISVMLARVNFSAPPLAE